MALRSPRSDARRAALLHGASAAVLLMFLQGCGVGFDVPARAELRADAASSAAGRKVRLVTSTEFVEGEGDLPLGIRLLKADTVDVTLPFQRDVEIQFHNGQRKLYVELYGLDGESTRVRLRVHIQERPWYDTTLDLREYRHRFVWGTGRG